MAKKTVNESQMAAMEFLQKAKREGNLNPFIERDLVRLVGAEIRPELREALRIQLEKEAKSKVLKAYAVALSKNRALDPEQQVRLLSVLEARLAKPPEHYRKRPQGIDFCELKRALEEKPELMWSIAQMENTGGAPDVVSNFGDNFDIIDCSSESPRCNLTYKEAREMAKIFGVQLLNQAQYENYMNPKAGKFDLDNTGCWVETHEGILRKGCALIGQSHVCGSVLDICSGVSFSKIDKDTPHSSSAKRDIGWRGFLRLPKSFRASVEKLILGER